MHVKALRFLFAFHYFFFPTISLVMPFERARRDLYLDVRSWQCTKCSASRKKKYIYIEFEEIHAFFVFLYFFVT